MNTLTNDEARANAALLQAVEAIKRADAICKQVGYGSQVLGPLDDALRNAQYALDTAEGKN